MKPIFKSITKKIEKTKNKSDEIHSKDLPDKLKDEKKVTLHVIFLWNT